MRTRVTPVGVLGECATVTPVGVLGDAIRHNAILVDLNLTFIWVFEFVATSRWDVILERQYDVLTAVCHLASVNVLGECATVTPVGVLGDAIRHIAPRIGLALKDW